VDDLRAAFGQRAKDHRERLGWSQEKLAERSGLDPAYVSGIERGQRTLV
jgi:transcriptional regulator with XRE-family HTH domain